MEELYPVLGCKETETLIEAMFCDKALELGVTPHQIWESLLKTSAKHRIPLYKIIRVSLKFNDLGMYILVFQDLDWYNGRRFVPEPELYGNKVNYHVDIKEGPRYISLYSMYHYHSPAFIIDKQSPGEEKAFLCTHTKSPLGDLAIYHGVPAACGWDFYKSIRILCGGSILFPENQMKITYYKDSARIEKLVGWIKFQKVLLTLIRFGIKYIDIELPQWIFSCLKPKDLHLFYKRGEIRKTDRNGIYKLIVDEVHNRISPRYINGVTLVKMYVYKEPNYSSDFPDSISSLSEVSVWGCTPHINFQDWIKKKGYDQPLPS